MELQAQLVSGYATYGTPIVIQTLLEDNREKGPGRHHDRVALVSLARHSIGEAGEAYGMCHATSSRSVALTEQAVPGL